jgi:hypothetical protein
MFLGVPGVSGPIRRLPVGKVRIGGYPLGTKPKCRKSVHEADISGLILSWNNRDTPRRDGQSAFRLAIVSAFEKKDLPIISKIFDLARQIHLIG